VNPAFDTFVLPEEHQLLRKTVREVADEVFEQYAGVFRRLAE